MGVGKGVGKGVGIDFTLKSYSEYLGAIKSFYTNLLTFNGYLALSPKPEEFCIIRHDVDRKPKNALKMAGLEAEMGIRATYYFRTKAHTFKPGIIKGIHALGHEIGYHYECLADAKGDLEKAMLDFEGNLARLRSLVPVTTIAMHGSPLKGYDNRDLWKDKDKYELLKQRLTILGEVYLDMDYWDVAFISDTGRNWDSTTANLRDKVDSEIVVDFQSGGQLLDYLKGKPHGKLVFQVHPERWSEGMAPWFCQLAKDQVFNFGKMLIRHLGKR